MRARGSPERAARFDRHARPSRFFVRCRCARVGASDGGRRIAPHVSRLSFKVRLRLLPAGARSRPIFNGYRPSWDLRTLGSGSGPSTTDGCSSTASPRSPRAPRGRRSSSRSSRSSGERSHARDCVRSLLAGVRPLPRAGACGTRAVRGRSRRVLRCAPRSRRLEIESRPGGGDRALALPLRFALGRARRGCSSRASPPLFARVITCPTPRAGIRRRNTPLVQSPASASARSSSAQSASRSTSSPGQPGTTFTVRSLAPSARA